MTTATSTPAPHAALSMRAAVGLVAEREITSRVRSKSFIISTAILVIIVAAGIIISNLVAGNGSTTTVAAIGPVAESLETIDSIEVETVSNAAEAERLVRDGEVDAAVLPIEGSAVGEAALEIVALDDAPALLVQVLSVQPEVRLLQEAPVDEGLAFLIAFAFGIVFFTAAITFGGTIAQSVVEEKQTRIVEILLTAVPARALLAGKVVGNSALALGQIVLIAVTAALSLMLTGQDVLLSDLGPAAIWFIVFFAVGFVLLAAMFAASASLVSRMEDTGTVLQPVTWLVMLPYFLIIFFNDNELIVGIMSYVPFSSPVGMPTRIFLEQAQWWEPFVSLVVLAASAVLIVGIGARIYENSLLRTGGRVKLGEALKG